MRSFLPPHCFSNHSLAQKERNGNSDLRGKYGPGTPLTHAPFYLEEMEADFNNKAGLCEKWI